MKTLCVIPARFASTRFPGKILADINGKPMIERVYEKVCQVKNVDKILIATDHQEVFQILNEKKLPVMMSSAKHISGTDRCIEVFNKMDSFDYLLNVQGDEPGIDPNVLDYLISEFDKEDDPQIATLNSSLSHEKDIHNSDNVKLVKAIDNKVLYFSRLPIPFIKNQSQNHSFQKHIGVYIFHKNAIDRIASLEASQLELAESLEQLRWMEHGMRICSYDCDYDSVSIDSPEDLVQYLTSLES